MGIWATSQRSGQRILVYQKRAKDDEEDDTVGVKAILEFKIFGAKFDVNNQCAQVQDRLIF